MVQQAGIDLNHPLDASEKPTLSSSAMLPKYGQAAVTLHGDYFAKLQSKLNTEILWSGVSLTFMTLVSLVTLVYSWKEFIYIYDNFYDFLSKAPFDSDFKFGFLSIAPALVGSLSLIGFLARLVSNDFKSLSKELSDPAFTEYIFGFDLKEFANLKSNERLELEISERALYDEGKNTHLFIYRDSPIAVISIKPLPEESTLAEFHVQITGVHVRQVFRKADLESLLFDWAVCRSRELYGEFLKSKLTGPDPKIHLIGHSYSYDQHLTLQYALNGFEITEEGHLLELPLRPELGKKYSSVYKFFGLTYYKQVKEVNALPDELETIKSLRSSALRKRRAA